MKERTITIRYPYGQMTLVLPTAFEKLSIPAHKQIFKLLFENLWVTPKNEQTVKTLERCLNEWLPEKATDKAFARRDKIRAAWAATKRRYTR